MSCWPRWRSDSLKAEDQSDTTVWWPTTALLQFQRVKQIEDRRTMLRVSYSDCFARIPQRRQRNLGRCSISANREVSGQLVGGSRDRAHDRGVGQIQRNP